MATAKQKKAADDAAKKAANTAFNTARKDPKPKNPNDGLAQKDYPQRAGKGDKGKMPVDTVNKAGKGDKKTASAPKPKARPTTTSTETRAMAAPPKPKERPSFSKGPASGKMSFSGNWTGAALTEMQKRGGAKINRGGGLLGMLKKKLGK